VPQIRVRGVRFYAYPEDHSRGGPRHVHGFYGGAEIIVELRADGNVELADRKDCIQPGNAKRSDVRKILDAATEGFERLVAAWNKMHV
jgi:Domain of unknown function (DUF4160)